MSRSRNLAVGDVSLTYESLLRRPIDLTAITREAPENSFSKRTHGKTHGDVAGPVSQQDDARQHQAETYPPYDISLLGGQNAGCGCQGADVDGVSRTHRAGCPNGMPRQCPRTVSLSGRSWSNTVFRRCGSADAASVVRRTWSLVSLAWLPMLRE